MPSKATLRYDGGPEVVTAAQEILDYCSSRLPEYCVHGASIETYRELVNGTNYLMRGGPRSVRRAVHLAVSLPGDTGSIVSGFRAGSRIYIFFDLKSWLLEGRPAYRSCNNVTSLSLSGVALLIPVPDFHQMAYDSIDHMMADAWVSQEAVGLQLPVAVAAIRRQQG